MEEAHDQYGGELHRENRQRPNECECGYVGKTSRDVDEHVVAVT